MFSCHTISPAIHVSYDLGSVLSIILVDLSVSPDSRDSSRLVLIVITSNANGYVGRSGPESIVCVTTAFA